jgi:hypothetical protein
VRFAESFTRVFCVVSCSSLVVLFHLVIVCICYLDVNWYDTENISMPSQNIKFVVEWANQLNLFWHTDKNFGFYAEVNFWDFVRNDNSNKGTTARLNETRFGPKKKSSPIYLGPKNLDTFWCTGWAWNWHNMKPARP